MPQNIDPQLLGKSMPGTGTNAGLIAGISRNLGTGIGGLFGDPKSLEAGLNNTLQSYSGPKTMAPITDDLTNPTNVANIAAKALGHNPDAGQFTKDYNGVFTKGYQLLNQTTGPNEPTAVAANGANEMAKNFITTYAKANNGKAPDADMIKNFVGSNLTPEVASKFIQGGFAPGAQNTLAQQWLKTQAGGNDPLTNPQSPITDTMRNDLSTWTNNAIQQGGLNIADQFNPMRNQVLQSAAAYGNMSNPNLNSPTGPLAMLNTQQGRSIGDMIRQIQGQGAQMGFGAEQQAREFGAQNQLANRQVDLGQTNYQNAVDYQQMQDVLNRQTATQLGKMQAEAQQPGILDYLNTAFSGLGALGGLGMGIGAVKNAFPSKTATKTP